MDKTKIKAKYFRGTGEPLSFSDNCLEGLKNLGQVCFANITNVFTKTLKNLICAMFKKAIYFVKCITRNYKI